MKSKIYLLFCLFIWGKAHAQHSFPNDYIGNWEGKLYIYSYNELKDSVPTLLTIDSNDEPDTWIWKTEYYGLKDTVIKDYLLRAIDATKGHYVIDEQNGITLDSYLTDNKLISMFSVKESLLHTSYEFGNNEIVFQVCYATPNEHKFEDVNSYSTISYQKASFKKFRTDSECF